MERCPLCGGKKKEGTTTYSVDLGTCMVVVRNVPAKVCNQCGEEWIGAKTATNLEKIVEKARLSHCQLEVVCFQAA